MLGQIFSMDCLKITNRGAMMKCSISMATLFAATALCTSACSDSSAGSGDKGTSATKVAYAVAASGFQNGIQNQQMQVITNYEQLALLMSVVTVSGPIPIDSLYMFDFSTNELIAIFLGENVGCGTNGLSIQDVEESDSTVTVSASQQVTVQTVCTLMPVYGHAYALVTIPKTTKPISLSLNSVSRTFPFP